MEQVKIRYSKIQKKFPREFILLQGKGCFWKKCTFCDYYEDTSPQEPQINFETIDKITGEFGVLDVINSGSAMELSDVTLNKLAEKIDEKSIKEVWFEVHWAYREKLEKFASKFKNSTVKFRTGIETFDPELRSFWNKGISKDVTAKDVAKHFKSICLLVGTENQSFESVCQDIETAQKYFERFMVNVFVPNSTQMRANPTLIKRFLTEIYPKIKNNPKIEISLGITDLGVG